MTVVETYNKVLEECRELAFDLNFKRAKAWKAEEKNRVIVGHSPVYFPREIVHAANGISVGILGTGDRKQIIKGDAYYQSYICHMPRGIIEMVLDDNLSGFDGFIFPSICDVMRNLSGMFRLLKAGQFVRYMDFPQNFSPSIGGEFYVSEMKHILEDIKKINGMDTGPEKLNASIHLYNLNRKYLREIYDIRQNYPWRMSFEDLYTVIRAGMTIPVEEHNEMLLKILDHISNDVGDSMDKIKVVVSGAFCEQPPIGLIRTIENAGCYVVDDDFLIGSRWIQGDVDAGTRDPLRALSDAYLNLSVFSSTVYDVGQPKGDRLAALVKKRKADGVIFAAPSFCDPALLDNPIMQGACNDHSIRYISFQYNENTGQFKVIKEQVGAFSDSIKLWEDEPVTVKG